MLLVCFPKVVPKCNELDESLGDLPTPRLRCPTPWGSCSTACCWASVNLRLSGVFFCFTFFVCHWRRDFSFWILKSRRKQANTMYIGGRLHDCFFKISPDIGKDCLVEFYFFSDGLQPDSRGVKHRRHDYSPVFQIHFLWTGHQVWMAPILGSHWQKWKQPQDRLGVSLGILSVFPIYIYIYICIFLCIYIYILIVVYFIVLAYLLSFFYTFMY